jgi:cation diffusion facilitator family transporter
MKKILVKEKLRRRKKKRREPKKKKVGKVNQEIFDPEFIKKHIGYIPKDRLKEIREHPPQKRLNSKKVKEFEEEQEDYRVIVEAYRQGDFSIKERQEEKEAKRATIGIRVSFACNVALMIIKVVVLAISGSLAILASLIDSILDLISGSIIFISSYLQVMRRKEYYLYPVGKRRLETIAVIVFAAAMFTATGELLIRAIEQVTNPEQIHLSFDYVSIALVVAVIVIKFCLWLYCRKSEVPTVRALAQDHYNDVFSNTLGTIFGLCGYYFFDYLDPIGAFIIGLMIMATWAEIALENIKLMTGRSADPKLLSTFTYVALHHDERIQAIESVRAYHVSNRLIVEVDIILPGTMSLSEGHDIGESLQMKLEQLPDIERAFVHLDFDSEHNPYEEHPQLIELHKKIKKDQLIKLDDSNGARPPPGKDS